MRRREQSLGWLAAYVIVTATPFVVAATQGAFWSTAHSAAPVATALVLTLLFALVLGRRWAWWTLATLTVAGALVAATELDVWTLLRFLLSAALLCAPAIRRHVDLDRSSASAQT
jgi:hypothetical protein